MPFSHYPKVVGNIVLSWVQPPPPDVPPEDGKPNFLGFPFSELNRFKEPIGPGASVVGYHDAQPFTRFYGSLAADVNLDVSIMFSNDEVDANGNYVSDDNIDALNYDALGIRQLYDPAKQEQTGRFFTMIYGRFIRVEIKNVSEKKPTFMRAFIRGSVF